MEGEPFALVGVNSDDLARARKAVELNELNWRSFQNQPEGAERAIAEAWRVRGWPTLVVIDADFEIRYRGHDGHEATRIAKELVQELKASRQGGE